MGILIGIVLALVFGLFAVVYAGLIHMAHRATRSLRRVGAREGYFVRAYNDAFDEAERKQQADERAYERWLASQSNS